MSHVDADLVNQDPTDKQKDAGNYSKAPFRAQGMRITIENPAGTKRKGVDDDGEPWESELKHDYGYIRSTTGRDKDHIDVFLGPEPHAQQHPIHVIDQMDHDTGDFDEHKVMLGFKSEDDAIKAYHENYPQGWRGFGEITALPLKDFKDWAFDKRRKVKPVSELVAHKTRGYADGGAVGVSAPAKAPAQPAQQKVDIYGQGQRTDSPEKKAFQQSMSDISNQWFADQEGPDEDWGGVRGLAATAKANERMAPILKSMGLNPDDYKDISPHLLNSVMQYNGVNDPVKAVQMVKAYRDATGNAADAPGVRDGIAHALANGSTVQDALNFANNYESSHQSSTSYMKPLIQAGMVAIGGAAAAGAGTGAAAAGAGTGAGTGASGLAGTLGMNAGAGATALNAGALNAGMSLAQGNNIGDALKAGAKGALLSPVGGYVGNAVGGGTLGTIVGNAASGGAGAALSGKDVMSGIRSGAINGIASAAGTAASDWAGGALKDSGLDPSVSGALSKVAGAGTKALVSGKDVGNAALGSAINSGVGYLGDQAGNYIKDATSSWDIPKFNLPDLPDINIDPRLAEYAKTIGTAAIKQNPTVAALTKSGTPGPAIAASAIAALTNGFGGSNGTPGPGDSGTQSPAATTQPAAESPSGSSGQSGGYSGGYGSPAGFLPVDNQQITSSRLS